MIKTAPASGAARYAYDLAGHLLEDADGLGRARIDYLYLGDRPIATLQVAANQLLFVHSDRLDTPQLATDAAQAVVWKAGYAPFGAAQIEASLIGQSLRFPGQEFDAETGWHHNGFRDYVPALGRYLQSDPIGLAGGMNTYGYAGANPIGRTDASGLDERAAEQFNRRGHFWYNQIGGHHCLLECQDHPRRGEGARECRARCDQQIEAGEELEVLVTAMGKPSEGGGGLLEIIGLSGLLTDYPKVVEPCILWLGQWLSESMGTQPTRTPDSPEPEPKK